MVIQFMVAGITFQNHFNSRLAARAKKFTPSRAQTHHVQEQPLYCFMEKKNDHACFCWSLLAA